MTEGSKSFTEHAGVLEDQLLQQLWQHTELDPDGFAAVHCESPTAKLLGETPRVLGAYDVRVRSPSIATILKDFARHLLEPNLHPSMTKSQPRRRTAAAQRETHATEVPKQPFLQQIVKTSVDRLVLLFEKLIETALRERMARQFRVCDPKCVLVLVPQGADIARCTPFSPSAWTEVFGAEALLTGTHGWRHTIRERLRECQQPARGADPTQEAVLRWEHIMLNQLLQFLEERHEAYFLHQTTVQIASIVALEPLSTTPPPHPWIPDVWDPDESLSAFHQHLTDQSAKNENAAAQRQPPAAKRCAKQAGRRAVSVKVCRRRNRDADSDDEDDETESSSEESASTDEC